MASSSTSFASPQPLNPEPSQPEDRAAHDLPPKSYADAVVEPTTSNGTTNGASSTASPGHTTNGSAHAGLGKGQLKQLGREKVVYEKHLGRGDQTTLTSIKPSEQFEDSLKHNAQTVRREKKPSRPAKRQDTQFASGRKAGAGWERSAYANMMPLYHCPDVLIRSTTGSIGLH